MASAKHRALHQFAKSHAEDLINHIDKKRTNYLIAVQWHDTDDLTTLTREDFMWIKGNAKVDAKKVKEAYLLQYRDKPIPSISIRLDLIDVADHTKVADLDQFGDRVIVFKAELQEDDSSMSTTSAGPFSAQEASSVPSALLPSPVQRSSPHSSSSASRSSTLMSPDPRQLHSSPRTPAQSSVLTNISGNVQVPPRPTSSQPSNHNQSCASVSNRYIKLEPSLSSLEPMGQQPSLIHNGYRSQSRQSADVTLTQPGKEIKSEVQLPKPLSAQPYVKSDPAEDRGETFDVDFLEDVDNREESDQLLTNIYLQELANETSPEKLEQGVRRGVQLLDRLKQSLIPALHTDDDRDWSAQIDAIKLQASRTRTVVGVVGNTGSGKSSCINSLLDYERLVPTNCMRACTAVVTEISYNYNDDEASSFLAEIEFIKPEEWEKELNVLFDDVIDSSGNISKEVYNPDSDAGIAYAKIRAVYYKHTKEQFAESFAEKLMREQYVRNVLGSTKDIKERDCDVFYKRLQHYVDSKEKPESNKKLTAEEKKSHKREMEFWPLIKAVRIYVKADALSTGAVIVDLPGVHDSNAARAAVAEGYMKQCSGLWIVAPITRAVDDKAAKNLLGNTFRRQLKYDGTYSAVTFICSKTDDISNTEATDSLGLSERMTSLDDELYDIDSKRRELKRQLDNLKEEKSVCRDTMDDADEQLEVWEKLQEELETGETVYAPSVKSKKRKRSVSSVDGSDDDDDEYEEAHSPADQGSPLDEDSISTKINELKTTKKDARRRRSELEAQMKELNTEIKELSTKSNNIESKRSAICIAGRNEHSKTAIQADFAAGIKELDQENQVEEDEDNFNPDEDVRDYEKVAESLPVFCVSSRAYQKLSGRLVKDHAVKGFTSVDETGIPALQKHAKLLTEGTRTASCRRFLNSIAQLRISMNLWASNDDTGAKLSDAQRDTEHRFLTRKLKELEKSLEKCVDDTLADITETLQENIFENFDAGIRLASDAALPKSSGWGAHRNDGGLHFMTYRATVRRNGVYAGSSGFRDFNAELAEPLFKYLATGWEKAFQRRLPHVLTRCSTAFSKSLKGFHEDLEKRARGQGDANPRLGMLAHQLNAYEAVFKDLANRTIESINEQQREANRQFTPAIGQAMEQTYYLTAGEYDTGCYARMKGHMANEVGAKKNSMFKQATVLVQTTLDEMCRNVKESMEARSDEIYVGMRRDYYSVLGNKDVVAEQMVPKWERSMREVNMIVESEETFRRVLAGDCSDKEDNEAAVDDAEVEGASAAGD